MRVTFVLLFLACPLMLQAQFSALIPYLGLTLPADTVQIDRPSLLDQYTSPRRQSADVLLPLPMLNADHNPAAVDPKVWLRPRGNAAILWLKPSDQVDAKMRIWGENPLNNQRDD